MIELSRHIESLLLKHNCVIIPNLGGFVAQDCPAEYIAEENLFLPPYRDVAFNPLLQVNDGLLAQSYMNATGTSYPETQRIIEREVNHLKRSIEENQSAELNGIGTLRLAGNGKYEFDPVMGGIVAPDYFGLDSVIAKPLLQKEEETEESAPLLETQKSAKYYTLRVPKAAIKYVAAAVLATVFYLIWPVSFNAPSNNIAEAEISATKQSQVMSKSYNRKPQTATFVPVSKVVIPADLKDIVEEVVTDADLKKAAAAEEVPQNIESPAATPLDHLAEPTEKEAIPEPQQQKSQPAFVVVLASQVTPIGAQEMVHKMQKDGFKETTYRQEGKMKRVTFGNYPNPEAANAALKTLRQQHAAFNEAWVLKL